LHLVDGQAIVTPGAAVLDVVETRGDARSSIYASAPAILRDHPNARRGACVPVIMLLAGAWLLVFALSQAHITLQAYTDRRAALPLWEVGRGLLFTLSLLCSPRASSARRVCSRCTAATSTARRTSVCSRRRAVYLSFQA